MTLDGKVGVIADAQAVESLAGIMGGAATAVSDATTNVYVEAAFWWPEAVAGRSRRFGFSTDAGHRFERGVDPALTVAQIERISGLIADICGTPDTAFGPVTDQVVALPAREPVTLRVARAAKVIGMPVTQAQCADALRRLGLDPTEGDGTLTVVPPSWRFDLRIEEDLIEEVIRLIGYSRLPDAPPLAAVTPRVRSESRRGAHALRHAMAALDYQETINFSFVEARWERELAGNDQPIAVANPIAAPLAVMRSSLVGSLLNVLRYNLARKAPRVRVFEIGRVFMRDASVVESDTTVAGVRQPLRLAGLACGPADAAQWGSRERAVDFYDARGDVEALLAPRAARFVADTHPAMHPGRCARVELQAADGTRRVVGHVGELHPRWRQAYEVPAATVLFELDLAMLLERDLPVAAPVPRLQSVWRDLALIVGETVTHDALLDAVGAAGGLVRSARLFDVYRPAAPTADIAAGERSLAIRIELRHDDETLTDERVEAEVARLVERLHARLGVRLRG